MTTCNLSSLSAGPLVSRDSVTLLVVTLRCSSRHHATAANTVRELAVPFLFLWPIVQCAARPSTEVICQVEHRYGMPAPFLGNGNRNTDASSGESLHETTVEFEPSYCTAFGSKLQG